MAFGYQNAQVVQLTSIFTFIFTFLLSDHADTLSFNLHFLLRGEMWRLVTGQILFNNMAQAFVALILLYTYRQFERQLGLRKFGAFVVVSYATSLLMQLAVVLLCYVVGVNVVPSSGPFFLLFALVPFYYNCIPKLSVSQYSVVGVNLSEKSWIYFLLLQLALSGGYESALPAACGFISGLLYIRNVGGLQKLRLPTRVESAFSVVGGFFASLIPFSAAAPQRGDARAAPPTGRAAMDQRGAYAPPPATDGDGWQNFDDTDDFSAARSTAVPSGAVTVSEENVQVLMSMGFARPIAVHALENNDNNVEAAANYLLR